MLGGRRSVELVASLNGSLVRFFKRFADWTTYRRLMVFLRAERGIQDKLVPSSWMQLILTPHHTHAPIAARNRKLKSCRSHTTSQGLFSVECLRAMVLEFFLVLLDLRPEIADTKVEASHEGSTAARMVG